MTPAVQLCITKPTQKTFYTQCHHYAAVLYKKHKLCHENIVTY